MPKNKIETVGELREFLTNMMLGVRDGNIEVQDASGIVKLAKQVNESFYAEVKIAEVRNRLAGERPAATGELAIGVAPKTDVAPS